MKIVRKGSSIIMKMSKKEWVTIGKHHHIDRPSEHDEILDAGKYAAKQGKGKSDNPYHKGSEEYNAWNEGYEIGLIS